MKIYNFENENIFKILNTKSRISTLSNVELSEIHKKLGELLSYKLLEEFKIKEIEIDHVQGKRTGYDLDSKERFLIIVLMSKSILKNYNHKMIKKPLSLYFHLPFCRSVCYFCGCNVIFTSKEDKK